LGNACWGKVGARQVSLKISCFALEPGRMPRDIRRQETENRNGSKIRPKSEKKKKKTSPANRRRPMTDGKGTIWETVTSIRG